MVSPQSPMPPPANPRLARWSWWLWVGVVAVAFGAGALWYFRPWVSTGLAVTTETVVAAPLVRVLAVNGQIAPPHLVEVKPTIGGALTAVLVEEGAVVLQGDILARVEASGQQAMVRQAMASLDAGLVTQSQAKASFARADALGGTIARTALEDAAITRQTADQDVARLTALLDQAQILLAKYTIVSPITGTILSRNAEVGQVVDATSSLFKLADLRHLVVETDVDETYADQITVGLPAVLQLKGGTAKLDGKVSFVAVQVDAATGGLAVKIAFADPVTAPVGLTVTANITVDSKASAITVPRAAVVRDANGSAVFLAAENHAVRTSVSVVDWPADRIEVTHGLKPGEIVITDATGVSDRVAISEPDP